MARRLIESFGDVINRYPPALPLMLTAWQQVNSKLSTEQNKEQKNKE